MQTNGSVHTRESMRAMRRKRSQRRRCYRFSLFLVSTILILGTSACLMRGCNDVVSAYGKNSAKYTIVLDSGHSTYNTGAHGIVKEEDITAQTTEYLRALLEANEDYQVILTHEYDVHATIAERRDVGIASDCDFFLSIHCNSTNSSNDVHGFEVYTQLPENKRHEESHAMATNIAQGFLNAGHTSRSASGICYCRYVPDANGQDIQYTLTEQEEAMTEYGGETYGVIKSDAYPSVLIEQGYVTSPTDVANWMSDEGMQAAAQIYYQAICDYFEAQTIT